MTENESGIHTIDLLGAVAIAALGVIAIRYLLQNPERANMIYMRGCLITKRTCQKTADAFQVFANHAGTEYNKRRASV